VVHRRVALGGLHGSPAPQDRFIPALLHEKNGDLLTQGPGQPRLGSVPGQPRLTEPLLGARQAAGEQVKGTEQGTAPGARRGPLDKRRQRLGAGHVTSGQAGLEGVEQAALPRAGLAAGRHRLGEQRGRQRRPPTALHGASRLL